MSHKLNQISCQVSHVGRCLLVSFMLSLAGCASIITGDSEDIAINTSPESGAKCVVSNSRGEWHVPSTPGTVTVKRSSSNLVVTCDKNGSTGSRSISTSIKSTAAGNLLFGGFIGAGVDAATGAAFDYPDSVIVAMK